MTGAVVAVWLAIIEGYRVKGAGRRETETLTPTRWASGGDHRMIAPWA